MRCGKVGCQFDSLAVAGDAVEHQTGVALSGREVEPGLRVGLLIEGSAIQSDGLGQLAAALQ